MAKIVFFLDMSRPRHDGSGYLKMKLTAHCARKVYSTGVTLCPEHWDEVAQCVTRKHPSWQRLDLTLRRMRLAAEEALLTCIGGSVQELAEAVEAAVFPDRKPRRVKEPTVIDLVKRYMELKQESNTKLSYASLLMHLERFRPQTKPQEVTRGWLMEFDAAMAQTAHSPNSRAIYMRNLRAVFNYAIDEEIIQNYPFRKFKIKTIKTAHRDMSVEDLRSLLTMEVEDWQVQYRDFFALSFFLVGMNAKDLLYLTPDALQGGRIVFNRHKTKRLYSLKMEPEAMEIIERYRGKKHLLNIMDERTDYLQYIRQCNHGLQLIGTRSRQGRKPEGNARWPKLTTYWARHSWATMASELDIPDKVIAAGLGHGQETVTDIYINFNRRKVDAANRRIIDFVLHGAG